MLGYAVRALLGVLALLGLVLAVLWWRAQPAPPHAFFERFRERPLVIAHADDTGAGLWPGNTMPFLEASAELGVDVLEMDVHATRDGVLVLMHDESVDRTTDGRGLVRELSLAELEALEVAHHWSQDGGASYPYRGHGLRVPTLEAVFERFPAYPMNIEMKQRAPAIAAPLCRLIRRFERQDAVLVASFHDDALDEFRARCPEVATSAGPGDIKRFVVADMLGLTALISPEYEAFQVPLSWSGGPLITAARVAAAHARGIEVQAWTINDPEVMASLLAMGIDGILSDRVDLLSALLAR